MRRNEIDQIFEIGPNGEPEVELVFRLAHSHSCVGTVEYHTTFFNPEEHKMVCLRCSRAYPRCLVTRCAAGVRFIHGAQLQRVHGCCLQELHNQLDAQGDRDALRVTFLSTCADVAARRSGWRGAWTASFTGTRAPKTRQQTILRGAR